MHYHFLDCPIPGNVSHGNVSYNGYTDGKIASYICHGGYVLSTANNTRVCRHGNWGGPEPTCDGMHNNNNNYYHHYKKCTNSSP